MSEAQLQQTNPHHRMPPNNTQVLELLCRGPTPSRLRQAITTLGLLYRQCSPIKLPLLTAITFAFPLRVTNVAKNIAACYIGTGLHAPKQARLNSGVLMVFLWQAIGPVSVNPH